MLNTGALLSETITLKVQLVAGVEQVTSVVPTGKTEPEGGAHTAGPPQLPEATGKG